MIDRRNLIKLMLLAGPIMTRPISLLADIVPEPKAGGAGSVKHPLPPHPRLFYNAASVEHLRQTFAADEKAYASLKKRG